MSFEQLQKRWSTQPDGALPIPDHAALLEKIKADSRDFDQLIARRDRREILGALLLLAFYALPSRHPLGPNWAYWAALGPIGVVTLGFFLLRLRTHRRRRAFGQTLTGELAWSIDHTRFQILLLTQLTWWYLLPLGIGTGFHYYYRRGAALSTLDWAVGLIVLLTFAVIYWFNQRAVRTKFRPQLEQLTATRAQWQALEQDVPLL
jgi:hypothetical protein